MKIILPNTDHARSYREKVTAVLREAGTPENVCEQILAFSDEWDAAYRVPKFVLSFDFPEGLTPEQITNLREQIVGEFERYGAAINTAKYEFITHQLREKLAEIMRS